MNKKTNIEIPWEEVDFDRGIEGRTRKEQLWESCCPRFQTTIIIKCAAVKTASAQNVIGTFF